MHNKIRTMSFDWFFKFPHKVFWLCYLRLISMVDDICNFSFCFFFLVPCSGTSHSSGNIDIYIRGFWALCYQITCVLCSCCLVLSCVSLSVIEFLNLVSVFFSKMVKEDMAQQNSIKKNTLRVKNILTEERYKRQSPTEKYIGQSSTEEPKQKSLKETKEIRLKTGPETRPNRSSS